MMPNPVLYGPPFPGYVKVIRLVFEEKSVPYNLSTFDFPPPAEYLNLNPFNKVPTLQHDDFVLYETVAIARYIDERFDGLALQPTDVKQRARMAQVVSIMDQLGAPMMLRTVYQQRFIEKVLKQPHDEVAIQEGLKQSKLCLKVFQDILQDNRYMMGSELTLADLFIAPNIYYFDDTLEGEVMLNHFPQIRHWMERMKERKSVQKVGLPELPPPKFA
jgi:glutathione S-transferase